MKKSEFEFIETVNTLIKEKIKNSNDNVGIGDDCAVIKDTKGKDILVTTDILAEKIHFDLSYYSFYDVGYKSAIVNISDIISKGGVAHSLFISLSIPKDKTLENILDFYNGLIDVCNSYNTLILGGDTTLSKSDFFISVTALGIVTKNKAILRSGAKEGDNVYVLGILGESDIGLKKLLAGERDFDNYSTKRHLRPKLFASEWYEILAKYSVSSSIDISDGLLKDLSHIASMSNLAIEVYYNSNWQKVNTIYKNNTDKNILSSILAGGEDYAIAFTSSYNIAENNNLIKIGQVVSKNKYLKSVVLIDSNKNIIETNYSGFEHF